VATLLQIRTALNGELGVVTDAETTPWSVATRNQAISDGYAALWRVGVWKPVVQTIATVDNQHLYALTSIRRLERTELVDSTTLRIGELPRGTIEDNGSGGWQLRMGDAVAAGYSLRVRGWAPYVSVFASDAAVDDLPAEHGRIPRLKAKAILYRQELGMFVRYGTRQAVPPEMQVSAEVLLGIIAAAEREFVEEAAKLARLRPRSGQSRKP
jgi:hypothetical protein